MQRSEKQWLVKRKVEDWMNERVVQLCQLSKVMYLKEIEVYHLVVLKECFLQEMVVHEVENAVHQLMRETVVEVMVGH